MILLVSSIIINRKGFTTRQFVVAITYLLLPIPPVIIELYTGIYTLTAIALTISVLIIYVLIQDVTISEGKMRESMLEEISSIDLLTGIGNRRSYYQTIGKLKENENVGVLFCDVNGLKSTNDHYGHAAGDELIKRFASILSENFRENEIFRISGDEFTVIIPDISQKTFEARCIVFRAVVESNDNIAAVGAAFGNGCCVERLVAEAETLMYAHKQRCGKGR